MKKTLVALATLSAIGSAFADVDVSGGIKLYGVIDQAAMKQSWSSSEKISTTTASSQSGLFAASSTSRLGVRGKRDLGNETNALFQIEIELVPQNNSDQDTGYKTRGLMPPKNRGTFVGLENPKNGSIRLGTQETSAYELFAMDVNGRVEYKPQVWRYTTSNSTQDRTGHSVKLTSPTVSGFTAAVMYAPKQQPDIAKDSNSKTTPNYNSFGLNYANEEIKVSFVRDREFDKSSATAAQYRMPGDQYEGLRNTIEGFETPYASGGKSAPLIRNILGASYDFKTAKVVYMYADSSITGDGAAGGKLSTSTFGVRVPLDNFAFAISYGTGSYSNNLSSGVSGYRSGSVTDTTFGAYYNFDKSTSTYILYSNSTHVATAAATTYGGGFTRAAAVGLKYVF